MAYRHPARERHRCLELLGLKDGAEEDDIKKAYKRMALKYHPDKNESSDAKEKFQEINYAYKYLIEGPSSVGLDNATSAPDIDSDILFRLFPWLVSEMQGFGMSPFGGLFSPSPFGFRSSPFTTIFMGADDDFTFISHHDDDFGGFSPFGGFQGLFGQQRNSRLHNFHTRRRPNSSSTAHSFMSDFGNHGFRSSPTRNASSRHQTSSTSTNSFPETAATQSGSSSKKKKKKKKAKKTASTEETVIDLTNDMEDSEVTYQGRQSHTSTATNPEESGKINASTMRDDTVIIEDIDEEMGGNFYEMDISDTETSDDNEGSRPRGTSQRPSQPFYVKSDYAGILPHNKQEEEEMIKLAMDMSKTEFDEATIHDSENDTLDDGERYDGNHKPQGSKNTDTFFKTSKQSCQKTKTAANGESTKKTKTANKGFSFLKTKKKEKGDQCKETSYMKNSLNSNMGDSVRSATVHLTEDKKLANSHKTDCGSSVGNHETEDSFWHSHIGGATFMSSPMPDLQKTYYKSRENSQTSGNDLVLDSIEDDEICVSRQNSTEENYFDNSDYFSSSTKPHNHNHYGALHSSHSKINRKKHFNDPEFVVEQGAASQYTPKRHENFDPDDLDELDDINLATDSGKHQRHGHKHSFHPMELDELDDIKLDLNGRKHHRNATQHDVHDEKAENIDVSSFLDTNTLSVPKGIKTDHISGLYKKH